MAHLVLEVDPFNKVMVDGRGCSFSPSGTVHYNKLAGELARGEKVDLSEEVSMIQDCGEDRLRVGIPFAKLHEAVEAQLLLGVT